MDEQIETTDLGLTTYLGQFLTAERRQKIDAALENRTRYFTVVLENIYQPHNASAVLRSAECFGIQDVHIIENEYKYAINKDVVMGANKWLDIHQYRKKANNSADCFRQLKESGYQLVATSPHKDGYLIDELPLDSKFALLFGTEKLGLSEIAMQEADLFVRIPMYGFTESFNISVSAAISMHHLIHRLHQSSVNWLMSETERLQLKLDWYKRCIKNVEKHVATYQQSKK
ncbi:MAG: RNA methyltransferase [Calditrichaeota bacterium]|nr:RNA methyltransferase [Calditrichota bacterium]